MSQKARFTGYRDLTQKDLVRIIELVAPNNSKGNVNVGNTRKVSMPHATCKGKRACADDSQILDNWRRKGYFENELLDLAEKPLENREAR